MKQQAHQFATYGAAAEQELLVTAQAAFISLALAFKPSALRKDKENEQRI